MNTKDFRKFWINEIVSEFPTKKITSTDSPTIPVYPLSKIFIEISTHQNLRLSSNSGIEVEIVGNRDSNSFREVMCFASTEGVDFAVDLDYIKKVTTMCKLPFFKLPNKGLIFKGQHLDSKDTRPRICILTPAHRRLSLLTILQEYMKSYLIPALAWEGFEALWLVAGGSEEQSVLGNAPDAFLHCENKLGYKKNRLIRLASLLDADWVIHIDSDDFFHPSIILNLIKLAEFNGWWSACEPFVFKDAETSTPLLFEGYSSNHDLHQRGMGSGRVFSGQLLTRLENEPYAAEANQNMDMLIKENLDFLEIDPESRLLGIEEIEHLPVGIKTDQNIWKSGDYPTSPVTQGSEHYPKINWLPLPIQKAINLLKKNSL